MPAIAAFAEALEQALRSPCTPWRERLVAGVEALGGTVLSRNAPCLPNTVSVLFDQPGDLVVMALDLEGVAVSTGSACSSGSPGHSHVVEAMGLTGIPVRLSTGPDTEAEAVEAGLTALEQVLRRMRST